MQKVHYFIQPENSGFVEGFNNQLKILKRRCYRIYNLKHLFQRIYLDLNGYRLFAATTIYAYITAIPRKPNNGCWFNRIEHMTN